MNVLIVAKTRRGGGACVGGITPEGRSVRLIAADADANPRAGLEYNIGDVWEIESAPDLSIVPPHTENIIVLQARLVRRSARLHEAIHKFMPPTRGGPEMLFQSLLRTTQAGALFVSKSTGLPPFSTTFWIPDRPLLIDAEGKRIRYRYANAEGGLSLTYVGFQEPVPELPAGALLRVSLAHFWRPKDQPEEELRCFLQLSGWFLTSTPNGAAPDGPLRSGFAEPPLGPARASAELSGLAGDELLARAQQELKRTFGFSAFLPAQAKVIERVLRGGDTLAVMPTGGGKSLCYQLPALVREGLTVVISPLVSLMQDQVRQLRELGIASACLNHTIRLPEWTETTHKVRSGEIRILYLAPETLQKPEMLLLLDSSKLACLAVDEAHCISEWGHDFRPEYRQLHEIRQRFAKAVCLALTATATSRVQADICRQLGIPPDARFVASFNRPNLFLEAQPRVDHLVQIVRFLEGHRGEPGIIYCNTRKQVDELCAALKANGWPALSYHAGLEDSVRHTNQERFIQSDTSLIVATIAFGMGINKSDVRFVVHARLPKDLEGYYQEIGRAGRDGLAAHCLLLSSRADAITHRHFIDQGAESQRIGRQARLEALLRYAEGRDCRRVALLGYFGEAFEPPCGHCDNCRRAAPATAQTRDATALAQAFLTCVQATGEVFGPAHIIAVLRGAKSERVLRRQHNLLPIYGAGREHSLEQWRILTEEFLNLGLVHQDVQFGSLRLTSKGRDTLRGSGTIQIPIEGAFSIRSPLPDESQAHDPELFERLRDLRKRLAADAGIPPFLVFSDRALIDMAAVRPRSERELLTINGVGEAKLIRYGAAFLGLIAEYNAERSLPIGAPSPALPAVPLIRPEPRRRYHEVGELFIAGASIAQLATQYGVAAQTVTENLYRFVQNGGTIDPARILAESTLVEADRLKVLAAFEQLGTERLAPIWQSFSGEISYAELHLLRIYLHCSVPARDSPPELGNQ